MMGAQWLALAHGVLHARGLAQWVPVAVVDTGSPARAGWIERLLGRHDDPRACELSDQSAGGDHAPAVAVADLPALGAPSPAPRWVQRAWAARLVPHFSARAPPLAA